MRPRIVVAGIVAAVLGLALAAGITLAASQLSSQQIGLSGEPLSAGAELVPRQPRTPATAEPRDDATRTGTHPAQRQDRSERQDDGEAPDGDD
jgi:hypothetical protein